LHTVQPSSARDRIIFSLHGDNVGIVELDSSLKKTKDSIVGATHLPTYNTFNIKGPHCRFQYFYWIKTQGAHSMVENQCDVSGYFWHPPTFTFLTFYEELWKKTRTC
jgi:hypothetical protein